MEEVLSVDVSTFITAFYRGMQLAIYVREAPFKKNTTYYLEADSGVCVCMRACVRACMRVCGVHDVDDLTRERLSTDDLQ